MYKKKGILGFFSFFLPQCMKRTCEESQTTDVSHIEKGKDAGWKKGKNSVWKKFLFCVGCHFFSEHTPVFCVFYYLKIVNKNFLSAFLHEQKTCIKVHFCTFFPFPSKGNAKLDLETVCLLWGMEWAYFHDKFMPFLFDDENFEFMSRKLDFRSYSIHFWENSVASRLWREKKSTKCVPNFFSSKTRGNLNEFMLLYF